MIGNIPPILLFDIVDIFRGTPPQGPPAPTLQQKLAHCLQSDVEGRVARRTNMLYKLTMDTVTYSKLRANLKSALDRAVDDHEVIVVERAKGGDAVLLSREDYDSMAETAYLLRSPANAAQLLKAMKRPKRQRKTFKSVAALKHAIGL